MGRQHGCDLFPAPDAPPTISYDRCRTARSEWTCAGQGISIWGHKPVGRTITDRLDQFRLGARSLVHPEKTVPALSGAGIPNDRAPAPRR
ncbi:putative protein OS=Streptomyces aurantiogriseus OX=66870 GN=GCM10010251_47080 PE=4 SV=1 [Streptomyces aurantiogriseus]|uniref:Uncharacterized protein n=1 Tax=Streptomyces aurantiogriseus TaxID=66870 RepID=A0A918CIG6_9ACTN|nr:hypothetical protein GCM10010251_47080 [Streptomyces aurantiogriseus]